MYEISAERILKERQRDIRFIDQNSLEEETPIVEKENIIGADNQKEPFTKVFREGNDTFVLSYDPDKKNRPYLDLHDRPAKPEHLTECQVFSDIRPTYFLFSPIVSFYRKSKNFLYNLMVELNKYGS